MRVTYVPNPNAADGRGVYIPAANILEHDGNPNGVIAATGPALLLGSGSSIGAVWVKTATDSGNTGWVQVVPLVISSLPAASAVLATNQIAAFDSTWSPNTKKVTAAQIKSFVNTGPFSNTTGELSMVMTGDQYGGSALYLRNRDAANGVVFDCSAGAYNICDMVFKTNYTSYAIVRLEQRSGGAVVPANDVSSGGSGEFLFNFDDGYAAGGAIGKYGAAFANVVLKLTDAPDPPQAGQIYFDGAHFQGYDGSNWLQLDNV